MTHVHGTIPYAWPYDGRLDPSDCALVVCGAQTGLYAASQGACRCGTVIETLRNALPPLGLAVAVLHRGQRGALVDPGEPLTLGLDIVVSAGWDGCFGSDLEHRLRRAGTGTVLLAGWASELTVDSTVRTLNDRGFECLVLTDACAPVDIELGARAHHSLTMSGGIFGALGTTDSLLAALAHDRPLENLP